MTQPQQQHPRQEPRSQVKVWGSRASPKLSLLVVEGTSAEALDVMTEDALRTWRAIWTGVSRR